MTKPRIIIVGGGLSGLCLAHALTAKGMSVTVFERDPDPEIRSQGYRLTIDATGSNALRACLPFRNYEFIRATAGVARKTGAFVFLDEQARELHRFSFDLEAAERSGHITGQVDRGTLRQALLSGLNGQVRFGKIFTHYTDTSNGVVAHFKDRLSAEADILVGADGVNSRVRRQLLPGAEPAGTGIVGIYGRTPVARVHLPTLGELLSHAGVMALGPRGRVFFCTAMRFRELPAIAAQRFGIQGRNWASENYFMWAVAVRQDELSVGSEVDPTTLHALANLTITGFHEDYRALVREAEPQSIVLVPVRSTPPLKSSPPGRVTLIGDAIHTMPPFGAHGANTAFKDAETLAKCLSNGMDPSSITEAIRSYESEMRGYSRPMIKSALRMMRMASADFPFKQPIFRRILRMLAIVERADQ